MFPFNQPGATAFYLTIYLATFVLHVLPMTYVLAGAGLLLIRTLSGAKPADDPLVEHFRQWLPFALSVAITAGVAPLLFLQILYQREFYTANLLLFHRWMAILPVLIVGFYLLYLVKGNWLWERPLVLRALVAAVILACFAFVGWSWSENHLLSTGDQELWARQYHSGQTRFWITELWPRLGIWLAGAFPVMGAIAAWPLARGEEAPGTARRLSIFALAGLIVSLGCMGSYLGVIDALPPAAVFAAPFRVWHAALAVGIVLQIAAWILIWRTDRLDALPRWLALAGAVLAVSGLAVCREAIRTSRLDLAALLPRHEAAAEVGGFWLFAVFLVINGAAIAGCIYLVVRRVKDAPDAASKD